MPAQISIAAPLTRLGAVATLVFLGACATSQDPATRSDGINDPYEAQNRQVHAFNKSFDRNIFRPVSKGYAAVVPLGVRNSVNNFSDNLGTPGVAVNSLLQGKIADAGISTLRFALNTTIGFGGIFDAASEFNMPEPDTDFGETLAAWGVGEGAYIELPFLGPSTQRDTMGQIVDFFSNTNPATNGLDFPQKGYPILAKSLAVTNDRAKFGDTIDSVLYESADSYAQTRLIYLQSSRFGMGAEGEDYADPYSDPYADPYGDAPAASPAPINSTALPDPYEDPYDLQ